jgi:hypothetical protein
MDLAIQKTRLLRDTHSRMRFLELFHGFRRHDGASESYATDSPDLIDKRQVAVVERQSLARRTGQEHGLSTPFHSRRAKFDVNASLRSVKPNKSTFLRDRIDGPLLSLRGTHPPAARSQDHRYQQGHPEQRPDLELAFCCRGRHDDLVSQLPMRPASRICGRPGRLRTACRSASRC